MKQMRYTVKDLQFDFSTEAKCLDWLVNSIYPDGIYCRIDKKITIHYPMRTRKSYSCMVCGNHIHPTAGTILHKSSTPLTLWFYAIYLMSTTRAGISAKQLERELGVTYKTAWRMMHQIRKIMSSDDIKLSGDVEVDEMYLGAIPQKRSSVSRYNHQIIFGMVERNGRAIVKHVKSSGKRVLEVEILGHIATTSTIYSDEWRAYKNLPLAGYLHYAVNHSNKEYVKTVVHTQNVENLWSNMKRGIKGVYRHVEPQYVQAYADEYAFRYSHRNDYQPMFWTLLDKIRP